MKDIPEGFDLKTDPRMAATIITVVSKLIGMMNRFLRYQWRFLKRLKNPVDSSLDENETELT